MRGLVVDAEWAPAPGYPLTEDERTRHRARDGSRVWRNPVWSVAQRPDPSIIGGRDVLIRNRACGLCGSDVHMYETDDQHYVRMAYRMRFPIAIGHEFAGEVVEVGPEVTSLAPGDPVAVEGQSHCGHCAPCRRGLFNQCGLGEDLGFTHDGGTAEYVVAREDCCWPLTALRERYDDQQIYEVGALTEPTSVAFTGMFLRGGGFLPGEHVAVFGAGPIGLAAVALARAAGAATVIAVETGTGRRQLAGTLGADTTIDPTDSGGTGTGTTVADQILEATRGVGVSMAVDATGAGDKVMPGLPDAMTIGGTVVVLGVESSTVPLRTIDYQTKAIDIHSSLGHIGGFGQAIALHAAGRIDLTPIVTARFPLDQGVEAIQQASRRRDAKILILPND